MCISLLSRFFLRTQQFEQIWLDVDDAGLVRRVEVYDIFFRTPPVPGGERTLEDVTLLAISPHDLHGADGELAVESRGTPGSWKDKFDCAYVLGYKYSHEYGRNQFAVEVRSSDTNFTPSISTCAGELLTPRSIALPVEIASDRDAKSLMSETGTIIELQLGELKPDWDYAMRLLVEPRRLNLPSYAMNIPGATGGEGHIWEREMYECSPVTLYRNTVDLLDHLSSRMGRIAEPLLRVLERDEQIGAWQVALPKTHRLAVITHPRCELFLEDQPGCLWYVGADQIAIPSEGISSEIGGSEETRMMRSWAGGTSTYWVDDPFEVAKRTLAYIRRWGGAKTKEEVTTALTSSGLRHDNTGVIVDALARAQLLRSVDGGRWQIGPACEWPTDKILDGHADEKLQLIAAHPDVLRNFWFAGFQLKYRVRYSHESPSFAARRRTAELKSKVGFWGGILGFSLGVIATSVAYVGPLGGTLIATVILATCAIAGYVVVCRSRSHNDV